MSCLTVPLGIGIVAGAVAVLFILAVAHVLNVRRRLRKASRRGREASAAQMASGEPLTTFNRSGHPGDPLNIQIHSTGGQLGCQFRRRWLVSRR